jgi:hypothetical protein
MGGKRTPEHRRERQEHRALDGGCALEDLADVERDLIRTRTAEGRNRAGPRGSLDSCQRRLDKPSSRANINAQAHDLETAG